MIFLKNEKIAGTIAKLCGFWCWCFQNNVANDVFDADVFFFRPKLAKNRQANSNLAENFREAEENTARKPSQSWNKYGGLTKMFLKISKLAN